MCGPDRSTRRVVVPSWRLQLASSRRHVQLASRRPLWDFLVYSNVLIIASGLSFAHIGHKVHGCLLLASGCASALFHREREAARYEKLDVSLAWAAFLSTLRFLPLLPSEVQCAAVALVVGACGCKYGLQKKGRYELPHALWHLQIAVGQCLVCSTLMREVAVG